MQLILNAVGQVPEGWEHTVPEDWEYPWIVDSKRPRPWPSKIHVYGHNVLGVHIVSGGGFTIASGAGPLGAVETPIARAYREVSEAHPSIVSDSRILAGKPCISGTRIPVSLVLRYLAHDEDPIEDLDLTPQQLAECLEFAATLCEYPTRI